MSAGTSQTGETGLAPDDSAETSLAVTIVTITDATSLQDSFRLLEQDLIRKDLLSPLVDENHTRVDVIEREVVIKNALNALSEAVESCKTEIKSSTDDESYHYSYHGPYWTARKDLMSALTGMADLEEEHIRVDANLAKLLLEEMAKAMNTIAATFAEKIKGTKATNEWQTCFLTSSWIVKDMYTNLRSRLDPPIVEKPCIDSCTCQE